MPSNGDSRLWVRELIILLLGAVLSLCGYGLIQWSAHAERLTKLETRQESTDRLLDRIDKALEKNDSQHLEILRRLPWQQGDK